MRSHWCTWYFCPQELHRSSLHCTSLQNKITVLSKANGIQARIGPWGFRMLRLPEFIDSTWRWQGCQPCASAPFYLQSLFCSWMRLNLPRHFQHKESTLFGTGKCTQCHFQQKFSLILCCSTSFCKVIVPVAPHGHGYTIMEHLHVLAERQKTFWIRIIKKDWYGELEWWLGLHSHLSSIHQISSCRVAWGQECNIVVNRNHSISY